MRKWVKKNEENDQQTENLQLFLKTGNGLKKRGNRSTSWEIKHFFEHWKRTHKKMETDQSTENLKLFWKPETDLKNEESDPKKLKPINKMRILNLFWKTGNGHKNEETDTKMRKRIENIGKSLKNKRPV